MQDIKQRVIDRQIREALANDFANRAREVYSSNPGALVILDILDQEIKEGITTVLEESVALGKMTPEEAFGRRMELLKKDYKPTIDEISEGVAKIWTRDKTYFEMGQGYLIRTAEQYCMAEQEDVLLQLKSHYETILGHIQRIDNIVNTLAEKAKEEGIEAATNAQSVRATVRKEFPTPEEYIHLIKNIVESETALAVGLVGLTASEEEAAFVQQVTNVIFQKTMEIAEQTTLKADVEVLYRE